MKIPCNDKWDAYQRIRTARESCLVEPSKEYLIALRKKLVDWVAAVDEAIEKLEDSND